MSETKHTPGPWKIYETRHPYRTTKLDGSVLTGVHIERRIATEWDHPQLKGPNPIVTIATGIGIDGAGVQYVHIDEADARLIAAAPDMLAALKAAEPYIAHFKGGWSGHTHGEISTDELLAEVRAAIRKATGDAQ